MTETIQIPGAVNAANDAKRVIAVELEAHRKREASLPRIAEKIQQNEKSNVTRMNAMLGQERPGHPGAGASKASQDMLNRFAAARRGAMLGASKQQDPPSPNHKKKSPQKTAGAQKSEGEETENEDSKGPPKAQRGAAVHTSLPDINKNHKASDPAPPKKMSQAATGRIGVRYRGRKQARAMQRRRGEGMRADSRVGRLLAEFNPQEDWVAQTILKHKLASILQANVKGWLVRKKWAVNREALVEDLHKRIDKESANEVRRAKLKEQLAERRAKGGEALAVLTQAFKKPPSLKSPFMGASSKWGKVQTVYNADMAASGRKAEQPKPARAKEAKEPEPSSSESSEFSDLEMDDIVKVKLRATTPPWQRTEESLWLGQYNKLGKKSTRAAIEATWDLDESRNRIEMARERRMARNHEGENTGKGADGKDDPAHRQLSNERVRELLYPAYLRKFARMGLLEYNPLDLPPSLADQHFEEEESESDIEDDEAKQPDAANGGQQVLAKDGKNGPSAQLKPSQAKSPEALAAELGIPVSNSQRARKSRVSADA